MREIKFKAYHKTYKAVYDVAAIDFESRSLTLASGEFVIDDVGFDEVDIMEFIGLKDKNGVEIYESDIVKVISGYGWEKNSDVVWGITNEFFGNYPAFCMSEIETELNSFAEVFDSGNYEVEVIGNIYENQELLN